MNVIIPLSKPTGCITPTVNPTADHGFGVVMTCQCRLIDCDKCPPVVGDVGNGAGCACVGTGGLWEISVPPAQFYCESKAGLNIKSNIGLILRERKSEQMFCPSTCVARITLQLGN